MRIPDYRNIVPGAVEGVYNIGRAVAQTPLGQNEPILLEFVRLRASQINGCAFCIDMHTKDARALGESDERMHLVQVWREAPCFSDRERAALAWTEHLTNIAHNHDDQAAFDAVSKHFSLEEVMAITWQIVEINTWNRLARTSGMEPGHYVSRKKPLAATTTA